MARSVLVVEPDVDALGVLASRLRALGLTVALADTEGDVVPRARAVRAEVLLLSNRLPDLSRLFRALDAEPDLAAVPRLVLARDGGGPAPAGVEMVPADDYDGIAQRVHALQGRPSPAATLRDDFRGELVQVSVLDLLQLLNMNRRTGVLAITTAAGAGEVHLDDGEVVDAYFRRLEAEKALFRLLAETDGTFAFTSSPVGSPRRIQTSTRGLLMDGLRQLDEVRRWRDDLGADDDVLVTSVRPAPGDDEAAAVTLRTLAVPRTIGELLDEVTLSDHAVFESVRRLLQDGRVRRIPRGAARVPLAAPEQLPVLAAVATRVRATGYGGPARIVLAGPARRLATAGQAMQRITDAQPPLEPPPPQPIPHLLGSLRISDNAELVLVALPTVLDFAPLWGLALAGAAAVVLIAGERATGVDTLCSVIGVPLFHAASLAGAFDEAEPAHLALLVRGVLDSLAGE